MSLPYVPIVTRTLPPLLLALVLLITACGGGAHTWHGSPYPDPAGAPEIELTDMHGDPFRLSDQRGKAVLLFFGYTYCPDICPTTVGELRWVFDRLGSEADNVRFVFITVDPDRDTPEALQQYLAKFHPDFLGLRGDETRLRGMEQAYGVYSEAETHADGEAYLVTHTARLFLVDTDGLLRTNYSFGTDPEQILADLRYLLGSQR